MALRKQIEAMQAEEAGDDVLTASLRCAYGYITA